jgi:hypothetical protein
MLNLFQHLKLILISIQSLTIDDSEALVFIHFLPGANLSQKV